MYMLCAFTLQGTNCRDGYIQYICTHLVIHLIRWLPDLLTAFVSGGVASMWSGVDSQPHHPFPRIRSTQQDNPVGNIHEVGLVPIYSYIFC